MENNSTSYLDNVIKAKIDKEITFKRVLITLIDNKFKRLGITLTSSQIEKIESQLEEGDIDSLSIDLEEEQEETLSKFLESDSDYLGLDFGNDEEIDRTIQNITSNIIKEVLKTASNKFLTNWKQQTKNWIRRNRRKEKQFRKRVDEVWGEAIDLLEILVHICLNEGSDFNEENIKVSDEKNIHLIKSLTLLHARGCQVSKEIILLLRNGFADGAYARWRTLYEITVTAFFIEKHGEQTAKRYLDYFGIINYYDAKKYRKHFDELGFSPLEHDEWVNIKKERENLISKYGDTFDKMYGWAANNLDSDNFHFTDIENNVDFSHFRPFFKLANINIHAGAKGAMFRIGDTPNKDRLIAGHSIYGLSEPGQNTAIAINQLTTIFLNSKLNPDRVAKTKATKILVGEIFDLFELLNKELLVE